MKKKFLFLLVLSMLLFPILDIHAVTKVSCGGITNIPKKIPELTNTAMFIIQVAVPVVLVIIGSLDFFKGITSQKEDEIKKGQKIFIKRIVVAVIIFFVIVITKFLVSIVADNSSQNIVDCIDCFLSDVNSCKEVKP